MIRFLLIFFVIQVHVMNGQSQDVHPEFRERNFDEVFDKYGFPDSILQSYKNWERVLEKENIVKIRTNFDNNSIGTRYKYFEQMSFTYENDDTAKRVFNNLIRNSFEKKCENQVSDHLGSDYATFLVVKSELNIDFYIFNYRRIHGTKHFDRLEYILYTSLFEKSDEVLHKVTCRGVLYKVKDGELFKYHLVKYLPEMVLFNSCFEKHHDITIKNKDFFD